VIANETDEIAIGALTLELVSMQPFHFDRYFNSLKPELSDERIDDEFYETDEEDYGQFSLFNNERVSSARNPWFNEFWEHRFSCNLTRTPACANRQLNETNWDSKLQFIVDATYVFAQALHIYLNCSSSRCPDVSGKNINGTRLFQLILETSFASESFDHCCRC
jgi:hypothetical protein